MRRAGDFSIRLCASVPRLLLFGVLAAAGHAADPLLESPRPGSPVVQEFNEAFLLSGRAQFREAVSKLEALLAKYPKFEPAYERIVELSFRSGTLPDAEAFFRSLLVRDPNNGLAEFGLARAAAFIGKEADRIRRLERCLALSPDALLCYIELPIALRLLGRIPSVNEVLGKIPRTAPGAFRQAAIVTTLNLRNDPKAGALAEAALVDGTVSGRWDLEAYYLEIAIGACRRQFLREKCNAFVERGLLLAKREGLLELDLAYSASLAQHHVWSGQPELGRPFLDYAVRQARALGHLSRMGFVKSIEGEIAILGNRVEDAISAYREAKSLGIEAQDGSMTARSLVLGGLYLRRSEYGEALREYEDALRSDITGSGAAQALRGIGRAYWKLGDYLRALDFEMRAARKFASLGDEGAAAATWGSIGAIYAELGASGAASAVHRRSLAGAIRHHDLGEQARLLMTLGRLELGRNEPRLSEYHFSRSLKLNDTVGNSDFGRDALIGLGQAQAALGRNASALTTLERGLEAARATGETAAEADALAQIGSCLLRLGRVADAEEKLKSSLAIAAKNQLPESTVTAMRSLGSLEIRRGELDGALSYLRKAIETIESTRNKVPSGDLRISFLRDRIGVFDDVLHVLARLHRRDPERGFDREALLFAERGRARAFLDLFTNARDPEAPPLAAQGIDTGSKRVLIFALGPSQSLAWHVLGERVRMVPLPGRTEIETRVSGWRNCAAAPPKAGGDGCRAEARKLYDLLLEPFRKELTQGGGLTIVGDGALQYLPFEALLDAGGRYLIEDHAIAYAPSLHSLEALTERRPGAARGWDLLAYGDPRFPPAASAIPSSVRDVYRSTGLTLQPLPSSRREVNLIGNLFAPARQLLRVGPQATESSVKHEDLRKYRILHFATHALLDDRAPARSGIALAQPDGGGEDGILGVSEILGLKLDADLVVLSACRTGMGALVRGEGVVGLQRAFQAAGARRVVVSLWNVADTSTADFMVAFYQALRRNEPVPSALRTAKLQMLRSAGAYRHPYYWAPFVVNGAW